MVKIQEVVALLTKIWYKKKRVNINGILTAWTWNKNDKYSEKCTPGKKLRECGCISDKM